jgi:hypothetical protein
MEEERWQKLWKLSWVPNGQTTFSRGFSNSTACLNFNIIERLDLVSLRHASFLPRSFAATESPSQRLR